MQCSLEDGDTRRIYSFSSFMPCGLAADEDRDILYVCGMNYKVSLSFKLPLH